MTDTIFTRMAPLANELHGIADLFDPQEDGGRKFSYAGCKGMSELLWGIASKIMAISDEIDADREEKTPEEGKEG